MKDESKYYVTLKGKVNVTEQEISQDVAAKIIRLIIPMPSGESLGEEVVLSSASTAVVPASSLTAKGFMSQKQPRSDMERIACLAYYKTHYQKISHFKTSDLSHLNAEAAQPKFSNAAVAVANSTIQEYLTAAGNGKKQITTRGEALVSALPDRAAVKNALDANPMRGNKRRKDVSTRKKGKK